MRLSMARQARAWIFIRIGSGYACSTDIENPGERIEVVIRGSFQLADELLIRPKDAEVWTHVADSGLTVNNYPIYPRP